MIAMDTTIDYDALGFRLTTGDVAEVLECRSAEVLDLVRAGEMAFLALPAQEGPFIELRLRFHPEEVERFLVRRKRGEEAATTRVAARVQRLLRAYLKAVPSTEDYDEAREQGRPLVGSTKHGDALHVEARALIEYVERVHPDEMLTEVAVNSAMQAVGALVKRGVVPASTPGGRQRWGKWWRIPPSVAGASESATVTDVVSGVRGGDEMERRGAEVRLKGALGVD